MTTRRSFLTGIVGFLAAPAIVRVASIMPVKVMPPPASLRGIDGLLPYLHPPILPYWQEFIIAFEQAQNERNGKHGPPIHL